MSSDRPWWHTDIYADRRPFLAARGRIKAAIRAWFESEGFTEVEPGCLQVSPGNEAHLHAFRTDQIAPDLSTRQLYLHTSPEMACKKLLAAGERRIFTFSPVFRNRERGALHAPEFTMLEWYRADAPYEALFADCANLLRIAAAQADNRFVSWRGVTCNPRAEGERLSVADAFRRYAGIDLIAMIGDREAFAAAAAAAGAAPRADDTWADIFSKVLTSLIEPRLGNGRPTLLTEYPASEAPLARVAPSDSRLAERFELYCCGVELANGFGEQTEPELQRRLLEAEMSLKEERYGERYPIDDDFIAALTQMPPASGCALGFDRLVMLASGATHIDQVLWTPPTRGP
jgi:lysyl-tRNA synthetase class 2